MRIFKEPPTFTFRNIQNDIWEEIHALRPALF